jgi:putative copper export protein
VVSADGHAISGDFTFYVDGGAGGDIPSPPPPTGGAGANDGTRVSAGDVEGASALLVATRAVADLALLSLAGLLLFVASATATTGLSASMARGLSATAPLLVTAYAWLWAGGVLGAPETETRMAALGSLTTGRALAPEVVLAWLVPWALLLARRSGIAAAIALMAVAVGGLGGHPASYTPLIAVPASVVHMLAASAWVGGLLFLVTEHRAPGFAASARRVSAVAFVSVMLVAATGLLQTWLFLGSIESLTSSAFGWLVLAKVAGFGGLVAFGAHHRLRLVPAVSSDGGAARLTRSVGRELALAACVVVLAAILSHTPPTP